MIRIAEALGITVDALIGNEPLPEKITPKPKNENVSTMIRILNQMPEKDQEKALNVMKLIFTEYADHFEKGPEDDDSQL